LVLWTGCPLPLEYMSVAFCVTSYCTVLFILLLIWCILMQLIVIL